MIKTRIKYVICATVLLASGFAGLTMQRMQAKSAASRPQPSDAPEMERLIKLYRGTWEYTETYSKSPSFPNGGENTGIYTSELGPGGMSILNRFHSKGPVGDFEGLLVMTWDAEEIVTNALPRDYGYGQVIFFAGDAIEEVLLLTTGRAKLTQVSANGLEIILRLCLAGEVVSPLALV